MLKVNSKEIMQGDTFLALKGPNKDGHDYIDEAIDNGAACIIATHGEYPVKTIIVDDTKTYLANYLKDLYSDKIEKIKIIGIVGTGGKTVTADIICQFLNNLNQKTAYIGTTGFYIDGKKEKLSQDTPDLYNIYELINESVKSECEYLILEVSSYAILNRHLEGIKFDGCVFTNLILNDIQNKEEYINTKVEAFKKIKRNGFAIINKDDPSWEMFSFPQNNNIYYGKKDSTYNISDIKITYENTTFKINDKQITINLLGKNNVYDFMAAYSLVSSMSFEDEEIDEATLKLHAPDGRYQNIPYKTNLIIIDYAYKPNTVQSIITETKSFLKGKLITIIGCKGNEPIENRNLLGKITTDLSDYVIFTTDNPGHEKEEDILHDMTNNLQKDNFEKIISRKEAIKKGINMLTENDILLILGKGHEDVQIIGNDKIPFKDYDEVMKIVK